MDGWTEGGRERGKEGGHKGRVTLLHSKVDEISVLAERRSAGKLTKGKCAGGTLYSPPLPAANPPLFPTVARGTRSKPPAN